jgi:transcriptional regulator with XRE-family HTH domain
MLHPTRKRTPEQIALDNLLNQNGIAKIDLARALGVNRSCISHILSGRARSKRVYALVAGVLGISVDELLRKYIPPSPSSRKAA